MLPSPEIKVVLMEAWVVPMSWLLEKCDFRILLQLFVLPCDPSCVRSYDVICHSPHQNQAEASTILLDISNCDLNTPLFFIFLPSCRHFVNAI